MELSEKITPPSRVKTKMRNLLIKNALEMFENGSFPSVTELALHSQISRATAYRYFPTQSDLVAAVVEESLKPVIDWQPQHITAEARVAELLTFAYPQMLRHEGALRAALLLSLQQWADLRAMSVEAQGTASITQDKHEKYIRGNRKQILGLATAPLKDHLSPELLQKVIHALSLVYGSEVFMVLKDIWQLEPDDIQSVTQWMAKAIINQAKHDQGCQILV
jgi:AcrR family transcriptional regulator